jgi:chemotaxis protein MotB
MTQKIIPGATFVALAALVLAACVSQSAYDEQASQIQQTQAQVAARQAEIAKMQAENRWVMAGDLLFPEGGYELSAAGQAALSQYVPQLRSLQNSKVVVLYR